MIIAYKAFEPDLSCTSKGNRFQYKIGIWNQEPAADCARCGFHCAENPLDCLSYYPHWEQAVYYMVLADGDIDEDGRDSKGRDRGGDSGGAEDTGEIYRSR